MTREERKNVLHCLKVMVEEEVCEECDLYGTTGTDHCEEDCVRMAIKALSQEPCDDAVSRAKAIENVVQIAKTFANSDKQKAMCGRIIFMLEHMSEVSEMITEEYYKPCSLCHNADCVWMGGKDTHKLCEDFQALSQEPTVTSTDEPMTMVYPTIVCDDAISREEVLYLIADHDLSMGQVVKGIHALPSVKQKSGKWIIKEDNTSYVKTIPRRWAECSCCKWSMSPGYVDRYAFCPNCGAKMESEE